MRAKALLTVVFSLAVVPQAARAQDVLGTVAGVRIMRVEPDVEIVLGCANVAHDQIAVGRMIQAYLKGYGHALARWADAVTATDDEFLEVFEQLQGRGRELRVGAYWAETVAICRDYPTADVISVIAAAAEKLRT